MAEKVTEKNLRKLSSIPDNLKIIDEDKNTQLHHYAASNRVDEFKSSYVANQKVDVQNYLGWTPLMMACGNGHLEFVKVLLECNADASKSNKFGYSVFLISVSGGNMEIVKLILDHLLCGGISKNSMQSILSPISLAILFRHHDIVEYLINKNFSLNSATPTTGLTPLMFAAAMEDNASFNLLLNRNADVDIKNHVGSTAKDIEKSKRIENEPIEHNKKPLTPAELISNSPLMTPYQNVVPQLLYTNPAGYVCMSPHLFVQQQMRRSSNITTPSPNFCSALPTISPLTPLTPFMPQMFFPPEFSPMASYYPISPVPVPAVYNDSHEYVDLNAKLHDPYISPSFPCM